MCPKYLQLATFAHNTFNTSKVGNYRSYELVFGRKPKSPLNLESTPDIKVSGTFKEYYELLNKKFKYLHKLLLKAVKTMDSKSAIQCNKLMQLESSMVMYGIYNAETLEQLINMVHCIHNTTSSNERLFAEQNSSLS